MGLMVRERVHKLDDKNFDDFIQKANTPVLVRFWAGWCRPCKMIEPVIDEVAAELGGKITAAKFNVDENRYISADLKVSSIPTLIVFDKGREVERLVGCRTKEEVVSLVSKYI